MYVGVLQLTRNDGKLDISGAAYGMGTPEWRTPDGTKPDVVGTGWHNAQDENGRNLFDTEGKPLEVRRWAMELRADYEHPLRAGPAVGFVLGEMPGGKVTGWIEDGLTLTSDSQLRLAIDDGRLDLLDALLTDQQKRLLTLANRSQAGGNGAGAPQAAPQT
jgi:hypothetical protein